MTDQSTVRTAIATVVDGVTDTGSVYAYERYVADDTVLKSLFWGTYGSVDQVRGFTVSLESVEGRPASQASIFRTLTFVVRGYMSHRDASATETEFADLIESVMEALDNRTDFGASNAVDYSAGPAVARRIEHRMFGSLLVHYAEIVVTVDVQRSRTYATG